MTPEEAGSLLTWLKAEFQVKEITKEKQLAFTYELRCMSYADVKFAIAEHMKASRFFPAFSDLLAILAERAAGLEAAEAAWLEVMRAISRWGRYRPWTFANPATSLAVENLGKQAICDSEDHDTIRAHFYRSYNAFRAQELAAAREAITAGQPFRSVLEGRRGAALAPPASAPQLGGPAPVGDAAARVLAGKETP